MKAIRRIRYIRLLTFVIIRTLLRMAIYISRSKHVLRKNTRGVDLLCEIVSSQNEDGSDSIMKMWHPLKELREPCPVEVAGFVVARVVDKMPAFAWWVSFTLKKRVTIIASVRSRIARTTHKNGIEILTC